ncbi:hypothetical protein ACGFZB_13700 [Streptomyces cinerochromogenes]|uniref:Uncharacterized protein n=1 Tax=Streptomyces cinerochromogenes TaxID=66422 RepID=A0ABW7B3Y1_9ACTN
MEIKPQAVVIPKDTDHLEQGRYGPVFPRTPACYGFTIVAKVKPGRADAMREYGRALAETLEQDPYLLAPTSPFPGVRCAGASPRCRGSSSPREASTASCRA